MPAKSVAQRRFMGMVRATQKGEMDNPSPELKRAAGDMSAKAVNKFAKTKEKNLPDKVEEETKYDKEGNDKYDRYKRMVRHKQRKYGVSTLKQRLKHGGVDHNIDNEKKAKMKEETEQLDEIAPIVAGAAKVAVAGARVAGKVAARGAVAAGKGIAKGAKSTFKAAGRGVKKGVEQGARAAAADVAATAISNVAKKKEAAKNAPSTAVNERADVWHPDPEKDRKLGGPGANQRAREDRAAASKPKSDPKKLKKGESYMDYAKRQKGSSNKPAAKPKERKRDRVGRALGRLVDKVGGIKEEAPTMSAGNGGFSGSADATGPTAGFDPPMMGLTNKKAKSAKKFKCKQRKDGTVKCEGNELGEGYVKDGKYFPFYVEIADTNFIFHGRSEADVKLKLRKIYRPEQMKNLSITRYQPAQVLSYYWNKRKESM